MTEHQYPADFLALLKAITNKRAKAIIEHLLEHGSITTEEIKKLYGYDHPPRAARDVRELGIPLETFYTKDTKGRRIGAYRFADPLKVRYDKLEGKKVFSKKFKAELVKQAGSRCSICLEVYESRYLQVDHRVPYEVSGDSQEAEKSLLEYMLLCGSCNRAKSWSCEHCVNWLELKSPEICRSCYWAHPESYKHIALQPIRRLDIVWNESEVETYEKLKQQAETLHELMPEYVKAVIKRHLK